MIGEDSLENNVEIKMQIESEMDWNESIDCMYKILPIQVIRWIILSMM